MHEIIEIYRSDNVRVQANTIQPRSDTIVVTFAHWHPTEQSLEGKGFAEDFIASLGFDCLCFKCATNAWWLYEDMPKAIGIAANFLSGWPHVLTYGSSMGGYAAIRFAASLGAEKAIAISPQYSIDPGKMPTENRWAKERQEISFELESTIQKSSNCSYIAIYDPLFSMDALHVCQLAKSLTIDRLGFPVSGHPAIEGLLDAGATRSVITEIMSGTFDPPAARRRLRAARRSSPRYWLELSFRCQEHGHFEWALSAALAYAAMAPDAVQAYRWAFARAGQMSISIHDTLLDDLDEPLRIAAAAALE